MYVDAPFICYAMETPGLDSFIKCMIPDATGLLHAVDAVHELPHPVLLARFFKARWLLHVSNLIFRQDAIEKSGFDIKLVEIPTQGHCKVEHQVERFEVGSGGSHFVIINAILLSIPLHHIPDFIVGDGAQIIVLAFAYKFAMHWVMTRGQGAVRHKNKDLKVTKALYLFASTSNPKFMLW